MHDMVCQLQFRCSQSFYCNLSRTVTCSDGSNQSTVCAFENSDEEHKPLLSPAMPWYAWTHPHGKVALPVCYLALFYETLQHLAALVLQVAAAVLTQDIENVVPATTPKADVWSFGVTLFQMLNLETDLYDTVPRGDSGAGNWELFKAIAGCDQDVRKVLPRSALLSPMANVSSDKGY